jgi:hypothetical protein
MADPFVEALLWGTVHPTPIPEGAASESGYADVDVCQLHL